MSLTATGDVLGVRIDIVGFRGTVMEAGALGGPRALLWSNGSGGLHREPVSQAVKLVSFNL